MRSGLDVQQVSKLRRRCFGRKLDWRRSICCRRRGGKLSLTPIFLRSGVNMYLVDKPHPTLVTADGHWSDRVLSCTRFAQHRNEIRKIIQSRAGKSNYCTGERSSCQRNVSTRRTAIRPRREQLCGRDENSYAYGRARVDAGGRRALYSIFFVHFFLLTINLYGRIVGRGNCDFIDIILTCKNSEGR